MRAAPTDNPDSGVRPRRGRRRLPRSVTRLVRLLLFFLIVNYLVLPQLAGARRSAHVLRNLNPLLAVSAVACEALALAAYAELTRVLLPPAGRPPLRRILGVQLATLAASRVVPGGPAASAPLGYQLLRQEGVTPANASFVLGVQAIGSAAVLNLLLWLSLAVAVPLRGSNPAYLTAVAVGILVVGGFVALVVGLSRGSRRIEALVRRVASRLRGEQGEVLDRFLAGLIERFRALAVDRRLLARAGLWASVNWLADAAALWIFLASVGQTLAPDELLIVFGLANISAALPVTPGGLGVYEAVATSTLIGFGVPGAQAVVAVLAYRLVAFWLPIPLGAVAYLRRAVAGRTAAAADQTGPLPLPGSKRGKAAPGTTSGERPGPASPKPVS